MLPVLLSTVSGSDRGQAGLPAARSHVQPYPAGREQSQVSAQFQRTRRMALLRAGKGERGRILHADLPRQQAVMHLRPVRSECQIYAAVFPRECR